MERQPLGCFGTNTGEMLQLLDQSSQGTRVNRGFDLLLLPFGGIFTTESLHHLRGNS